MGLFNTDKKNDSSLYGLGWNVLLAVLIFLAGYHTMGYYISTLPDPMGEGEIFKSLVYIFELIPLSMLLSGIINGIVFTIKTYYDAAKINYIIALTGFLIGGTCALTFLTS